MHEDNNTQTKEKLKADTITKSEMLAQYNAKDKQRPKKPHFTVNCNDIDNIVTR